MPLTTTSVDELVERESRALADVLALVERVAPDTPVGDGSWSAADVLAHLVTVGRRYLNPATRLAPSLAEVAVVNDDELGDVRGRSVDELAEELAANQRRYQRAWAALPLDIEFPFHAGLLFDVATLRSNWLAELRVHGWDVARAGGEPTSLDDRDMLLASLVVVGALPALVRAGELGVDATFVLAPDGSTPQQVGIRDGTTAVADGAPDGGVAATVTGRAAPLAMLLYRRVSLAEAEADGLAVTGDRDLVQRLLDACDVV